MSSLKSRISKLEHRAGGDIDWPIIFVIFGEGEEDIHHACIVNCCGVHRSEGESVNDFKDRAYATKAAGCPLKELDQADIQSAYAAGRELRAMQ